MYWSHSQTTSDVYWKMYWSHSQTSSDLYTESDPWWYWCWSGTETKHFWCEANELQVIELGSWWRAGGHIGQLADPWQLKPEPLCLSLGRCQLLLPCPVCSSPSQMTLWLFISKAGVVRTLTVWVFSQLTWWCLSRQQAELQHMANKVQRSLVYLSHLVWMCISLVIIKLWLTGSSVQMSLIQVISRLMIFEYVYAGI